MATTTETETPSWGDVFKDKALIITLVVMFQFFALIVMFSQRPSQMAPEAKMIILQTFVIAFTAAWGFWLGASVANRGIDRILEGQPLDAKDGPVIARVTE